MTNFQQCWQFWQFSTMLTIFFTNLTIFCKFWQCFTILTMFYNFDNVNKFWQVWPFLQFMTILTSYTFFENCWQFWQFRIFFDDFDNCFYHFNKWKDNPGHWLQFWEHDFWEHDFMTINFEIGQHSQFLRCLNF